MPRLVTSLVRTRRLRGFIGVVLLCAPPIFVMRASLAGSSSRQTGLEPRRFVRRQHLDRVEEDVAASDERCHAFLRAGTERLSPVVMAPEPHELFSPSISVDVAKGATTTILPGPHQIILGPNDQKILDGIADSSRGGDAKDGSWYDPRPSDPPRRIFFISFNTAFRDASYLCAIEAAALLNPTHFVDIYTVNVTDVEGIFRRELGGSGQGLLDRIRLKPISYWKAFENTPFEPWYTDGSYAESTWVAQNLGNALRLAILWKEGGTYFDLDVLSINPLGKAARAIAMQDDVTVNNAALTFPPHDPFIWAAMNAFVSEFQGKTWGWQGPLLITRVLRARCPFLSVILGLRKASWATSVKHDDAAICAGLTVWDASRYYAIHYSKRQVLEAPWNASCPLLDDLTQRAIGLHLWHSLSRGQLFDRSSVYMRLLERGCPYTDIRARATLALDGVARIRSRSRGLFGMRS